MSNEFHRTKRLPPYVFAEVNKLKAAARAAGRDIIDFGMGNPDQPPAKHVSDKLAETLQDPRAHRYSNSRGIPGLRKALAAYYARRFNVEIDPEREAIVTLGSKEGLANLAQAITSPGDVILAPNPSYPIHAFGFIIAGAAIRSIPFHPGPDFLVAMDRAVRHSVPKPLAVIVNYPSNPTAEVADLDFYREVVAFCRKHEIFIISDIAYAEVYFDGNPPPSVLQVPGAKDIAVEFSSLSKTYSMPGWRIGFCVGNQRLVGALTRVKSYLDYGAFTPIQVAATAALNGPQDCIDEMRARYKSRRDVLIEGSTPRAGQYRPHRPPCLPGHLFRNATANWARWSFRSCLSRKLGSPWRQASALANMGMTMSASPWSRTSIVQGRRFGRSRQHSDRLSRRYDGTSLEHMATSERAL